MKRFDLVFLGLSLSSSWGNGHATTYRALLRALTARGHRILFLERDVPWYARHRDLPVPSFCSFSLYNDVAQLQAEFGDAIARADAVVVGSYTPQGIDVCREVLRMAEGTRVYYDIDTPVTLAKVEADACEYVSADLIRQFDLYCSFSGGRALQVLEKEYGSPCARALYCSVDPELYQPRRSATPRWELGYLGAYSDDRQLALDRLLLQTAGRTPRKQFVVAGAQYPEQIEWPDNVERIEHVPPAEHPSFYGGQRATLNITRQDMRRLGHSPSVRLFEAAACAVPIISDRWTGIDELFVPDEEIVLVDSTDDVVNALQMAPDQLERIGQRARLRILAQHTAGHRAVEFEQHLKEAAELRRSTAMMM